MANANDTNRYLPSWLHPKYAEEPQDPQCPSSPAASSCPAHPATSPQADGDDPPYSEPMPHTLSPQLLDARARVITREHTAEITEAAGAAVRQLTRHLLELPAEARYACYRIADVAHELETTMALQRESWRRDSLDSIALRRARAEGKMMDLAHAALFTHRQAAHRHTSDCLQNAKHRAAAATIRDVLIPAIAASPELAYGSLTTAPTSRQ